MNLDTEEIKPEEIKPEEINQNTISWLEKYRTKCLSEYYIEKQQLDIVKTWIKDFRNNEDDAKPFLILHGTAGIGKTTLAYLILNYYNYEIYVQASFNF